MTQWATGTRVKHLAVPNTEGVVIGPAKYAPRDACEVRIRGNVEWDYDDRWVLVSRSLGTQDYNK